MTSVTWSLASAESSTVSRASTPNTARSVLFETFEQAADSTRDPSAQFILVVGGLGYIGSHTSIELLRAGHNIIIIDNLSNSYLSTLEKIKSLRDDAHPNETNRPYLEFFEVDYRDQASMRLVLSKFSARPSDGHVTSPKRSSISGVIHFAAFKAVAESFQKPLEYYSNNVGGLVNFCSTLGEFGIKQLVFSSSATVYGTIADNGGRLMEEYCNSTGCTGLTNPYGRTKWMCEAILSDLAFSDPEWTIIALRYFNPIGCDGSGELGEDPRASPNNLMPVVVNVMTGKLETLNIFGTDWDTADGTAVRDFIHVSDLAKGHLAAIHAAPDLGSGFKVFNLGTGTGHSVKEIVQAMERVSGRSIPTNPTGRREGDVGMCIAEPSRSAKQLGWKTEKTLDDCCTDICRFLNLTA